MQQRIVNMCADTIKRPSGLMKHHVHQHRDEVKLNLIQRHHGFGDSSYFQASLTYRTLTGIQGKSIVVKKQQIFTEKNFSQFITGCNGH